MTFCKLVVKYCGICKDYRQTKQKSTLRSERESVKALRNFLSATCLVAREDRDGCSRYRAAKMPAMQVN